MKRCMNHVVQWNECTSIHFDCSKYDLWLEPDAQQWEKICVNLQLRCESLHGILAMIAAGKHRTRHRTRQAAARETSLQGSEKEFDVS